MTQDANDWVTPSRKCQVTRGDYTELKPKIGHLIAHNPLDLVCMDFVKVVHLEHEKNMSLSSWTLSQIQCSYHNTKSKGFNHCKGPCGPMISYL